MKIVFIIPGSGNTFYCQNCLRDFSIVAALRKSGNDVIVVPLYLPLENPKGHGSQPITPVFYGAVNVYLRQKLPFYKMIPVALSRYFDSDKILEIASGKAGSTDSKGLEKLTISILEGKDGTHREDLEKLVSWLKANEMPDVIHISNALLLGIGERIKDELGVPVACTFQDEHQWIDSMDEISRGIIYRLMAEKLEKTDLMISVSSWYAGFIADKLGIQKNRFVVVPPGIAPGIYPESALDSEPPVIAYLSKICQEMGFEILVDAFIKLKTEIPYLKKLKLIAGGGFSGSGRAFLKDMSERMKRTKVFDDFTLMEKFDGTAKAELLKRATLLTVPNLHGEAFGFEILESFAAGVPVVLPDVGAYPEIIRKTEAGLIYSPNNSERLAAVLAELLKNKERIHAYSVNALKAIESEYSAGSAAAKYLELFECVIRTGKLGG